MLLSNKVAKESGLVAKKGQSSMFSPFGAVGQMTIKSLEVGGLNAEDVSTVVMDHPTVDLISKHVGPIEGIVGFPFFARYRMTIDFRAKKLTFVPSGFVPPDALQSLMSSMTALSERNPKPKMLAPAGQWGLAVEKLDETEAGVTIREVRSGSAADQAGLKTGDRLLVMGDYWTDSVADVQNAVSRLKPESEWRVKIRRDGKELTRSITPRRGL
jgi:hypothetical protein